MVRFVVTCNAVFTLCGRTGSSQAYMSAERLLFDHWHAVSSTTAQLCVAWAAGL